MLIWSGKIQIRAFESGVCKGWRQLWLLHRFHLYFAFWFPSFAISKRRIVLSSYFVLFLRKWKKSSVLLCEFFDVLSFKQIKRLIKNCVMSSLIYLDQHDLTNIFYDFQLPTVRKFLPHRTNIPQTFHFLLSHSNHSHNYNGIVFFFHYKCYQRTQHWNKC